MAISPYGGPPNAMMTLRKRFPLHGGPPIVLLQNPRFEFLTRFTQLVLPGTGNGKRDAKNKSARMK